MVRIASIPNQITLIVAGICLLATTVNVCAQSSNSSATTEYIPKESKTTVVVQPTPSTPSVVIQPQTSSGNATTPQTPTVVIQPKTNAPDANIVVVPVVQEDVSDSQRKVEEFVRSAADYIKKNGKEAGFTEFNKENGQFTNGATYIFAMDYKGTLLSSGNKQEMIGTNQFDLQDLSGKYIMRDLISKAQAGGGWETFRWTNPGTKALECKKTYVLPMEGYFIASGYYFLPNAEGKCD